MSFTCETNYASDVHRLNANIAAWGQIAKHGHQLPPTIINHFVERFLSQNMELMVVYPTNEFVLKAWSRSNLEHHEIYKIRLFIEQSNSTKDPKAPAIVILCAAEDISLRSIKFHLQHVAKTHFLSLQIVNYWQYLPAHITQGRNEIDARRMDSLLIVAHGTDDQIYFIEDEEACYKSCDVKSEHFPLPADVSVILTCCNNGNGIAHTIAEAIWPRPIYASITINAGPIALIAPCCKDHNRIEMVSRFNYYVSNQYGEYGNFFDPFSHEDVLCKVGSICRFQKLASDEPVKITLPCRATITEL